MAYRELHRCQCCMKRRQVRHRKDGNKQTERKTEPISLPIVGPSRLGVCHPGDNSISWCGKSPTECLAGSPWKLIMVAETPYAILNEMSHPGECHRTQRYLKKEGFFASAKKKDFLKGANILTGYNNMEGIMNVSPDPGHGCSFYGCFFVLAFGWNSSHCWFFSAAQSPKTYGRVLWQPIKKGEEENFFLPCTFRKKSKYNVKKKADLLRQWQPIRFNSSWFI